MNFVSLREYRKLKKLETAVYTLHNCCNRHMPRSRGTTERKVLNEGNNVYITSDRAAVITTFMFSRTESQILSKTNQNSTNLSMQQRE